MYSGRILAVGRNKKGKIFGMYRVSSRSFPDRKIITSGTQGLVIPTTNILFEDINQNPYVSYTCLKIVREFAILTNGEHTTPIAGQINNGLSPRQAMINVLSGMDYEFDQNGTPRIALVIDSKMDISWLGIISKSQINIQELNPNFNCGYFVSTNEFTNIGSDQMFSEFDIENGKGSAKFIWKGNNIFEEMEFPVCSIGIAINYPNFDIGTFHGN